MGRDALIVGISTYTYSGLKNLEAPAKDAEAIAQQLESSAFPFRVERLPGIKDKADDGMKTGKKTQVSLRQLKEALVRYFKPRGETYTDTVLFYYSGHGLYDELTGNSYLATSDANPEDEKWGYALRDLSELLRDSPVKRQIVWLDCCHSGELVVVKDANLGEQAGYSRCFVAASQAIEPAYELASGSYSVLTDGLLQGLNPERLPGQWIDTLSLCAFVNQYLKDVRKTYPQRSLFLNVGEPIDLTSIVRTGTSSEALKELQADICPYRALNAFDFTPEDVQVFFGRRSLTDELLAKIYEHNFLAVLGSSGSGKSSVVRAGLLYEIKQGKRRSGTETWQILPIIKPTESPLRSLAGAFMPETLRTKKKGEALLNSSVASLREHGATALVKLIEDEDYEQPVVLVVDQFEEIFTLCRGSEEKEQERKQFLDCLFGAVDALAGKLRLVITLRADFLGKCLEQSYGNLAERIKHCRVDVTPLTDSELDEAITKPAATVGLQVAPYLQERLKEHIKEAPGSLPLLQYALTELWRDWHTRYVAKEPGVRNQLTFEGYDRIGGVAGALEKQADAVYELFAESPTKQGLVQRIFLELVQPGEETEDTRRRVQKQELISAIHPEPMVDEVLGKLVESRLIVTDQIPIENAPNAVVIDLAHEATLRHWKRLRYWLNKHRQDLPLIRQLRNECATWQSNQRQSKYLLVSAHLDAALECLEKYRELGYLNQIVQNFVRVSWDTWIAEETQKEEQILEALCMTAEVQWNQHQQLKSLLSITRAGNRLQQILKTRSELEPNNRHKVVAKLQQILYYPVREKNCLEGHSSSVTTVVYSPDGKTLASASSKNEIKLWNAADGSLIASMEIYNDRVNAVGSSNDKTLTSDSPKKTVERWNAVGGRALSNIPKYRIITNNIAYSPDSKILASASADNRVKLWSVADGSLITSTEGHKNTIHIIAYSPDGKTLASSASNLASSASSDNEIKFWNATDGSLIASMDSATSRFRAIAYSPNGKTFASAGADDNLSIWNTEDGSLITTLEGKISPSHAIAYSPDGKTLAASSLAYSLSHTPEDIKLWNAEDGNLIAKMEGHSDRINAIAYSLNGKTLASASDDNTVKLWNVEDGNLIAKMEGHSDRVNAIAYSPDGKTIASASDDNTVKLWNGADGSLISSLERHGAKVFTIAYSPDGKTLASAAGDKTVKLWNVVNDNLIMSLESHEGWVLTVTYSPDGKTFASASADNTVKLWNATDGSLITSIKGRSHKSGILYSPDGKTLASAAGDNTVKLWNAWDGSFITSLESSENVFAIAYSPDGKTLASSSISDKEIKFWNTTDASLITSLKSHTDRVFDVVYSPDGKTLASAGADNTVKLWNTTDGSLITSLESHTDTVFTVIYSPDSKTLVSAGSDNRVKLWKTVDGSLLTSLESYDGTLGAVAYSPDGKTLAFASGSTIKLWNTSDSSLIANMKGHSGLVNAIAYSPGGKTIASASSDKTVKLWNTLGGSLIASLEGHTDSVYDLDFSPDGKILVSASYDTTVKLWNVNFDLDIDALMVRACDWLHDYLTHNPNVSNSDRRLLEGTSASQLEQT